MTDNTTLNGPGLHAGSGDPSSSPLVAKQKSVSWIFRSLFILAIVSTALIAFAGVGTFYYFSRSLPKIISVADYRPFGVTRILGNGGKESAVFGEFKKERRFLVPYDKIPDVAVKAFISAEDDKFFEHQGFNLAAIVRASIANFKAGHVVQGGSTITQQVAKSLLHSSERSFVRKIKEVILASRMESNLSKQQILYLYLNEIYLGHSAYGVQAAARSYFHKEISDINLGEAAMLAGMPQAPGKYSPLLNPKRAKERQLYVLRRMYENKFVTQAQMTEAGALPLRIYEDDEEEVNRKYAPYLVEHLRRYLVEKYGDKAVYEDGMTVTVAATPELCLAAKNSVQEGLRTIDKRIGYRGPVKQLKDIAETEKTLKDQRHQMIHRKLGYQVFTPDGRIDAVEAMHDAKIDSEVNLMGNDAVYPAVVTSVDDKRKVAGVMIGAIKAEIPMEYLKWARAVKDEKNPTVGRGPEPRLPSDVLVKGDVIEVKLVKAIAGQVIVSLEQEPQIQGALFSVDTQTGQVLAMEGGFDYEKSEFNRVTQALRQPGSSFKPIIYAAALEKGYTPATVIQDSPIVYQDSDNGKWKPENFEEKFYGDTTFRQALIKSRNVPTIKIVQSIQVPYVIDYAKRLGMNGQFNADLSISLGSASISLMDMTRTYALFPRLGRKVDPVFFGKIEDRDGKVLEETKSQALTASAHVPPVTVEQPSVQPSGSPSATLGRQKTVFPVYPLAEDPNQLMDPRVAYVMTHLMNEVVNYGTGHDAKTLNRAAAGKTGTTNDYIDAWFMGFTPHVVTGVWVGFDNHRSIGPGETGARAALPIWLGFMKEAVKNYPDTDFAVPSGVVFQTIDSASGKLAAPNSSQSIKEAFIEGTEPTETSSQAKSAAESQGEFLKEDIE